MSNTTLRPSFDPFPLSSDMTCADLAAGGVGECGSVYSWFGLFPRLTFASI